MPDTLLNVLKYFLFALLWLFFLRAMRAVYVEVKSSPASVGETPPIGAPARMPGEAPAAARFAPSVTGRKIPLLRLTVTSPPDRSGTVYELADEESVIGRAAGCAISIGDDTFISHLHARIFLRGSEFWIEDLGSTNGSFVNQKKLTSPVPLRNGDRVQVGRTVIEVEK